MKKHARRIATVSLGLAIAAPALLGAVPAFAEGTTTIENADSGTTKVTVETSNEYLAFSVPTIIPFVAQADGELIGPSASATKITNLSVFGIHVTKATVDFDSSWTGVADASRSTAEDAISFQFGAEGTELLDAYDAGDDDVSASKSYNMGYAGSDSDSIAIETEGCISQVTNNLVAGVADEVATITWTISAGNA